MGLRMEQGPYLKLQCTVAVSARGHPKKMQNCNTQMRHWATGNNLLFLQWSGYRGLTFPQFQHIGNSSLPQCLMGHKPKATNHRLQYPAFFLNPDRDPVLCGGDNGFGKCMKYQASSGNWEEIGSVLHDKPLRAWDYNPDVGLVIAGGMW